MVLYQELTSGLIGPLFQLFEESGHLRWVQVVDRKLLVNSGLDGVRDLAKSIPKLVLNPAEASVKQCGVGHDGVEQSHSHFIEGVLDPCKVLREVLNDLKELPGGLAILEELP